MVSIGRFRTPIVDACLPCNWYPATFTCPRKMTLTVQAFGGDLLVAANFAGRGQVGDCGGTDSYVTFDRASASLVRVDVDVWAAYRAGVWSSSTTVLVYTKSTGPNASDRCIVSPSGGTKTFPFPPGGICPVVLWGTVTVNDDGTLSIA
jgi:hypothetical protein